MCCKYMGIVTIVLAIFGTYQHRLLHYALPKLSLGDAARSEHEAMQLWGEWSAETFIKHQPIEYDQIYSNMIRYYPIL